MLLGINRTDLDFIVHANMALVVVEREKYYMSEFEERILFFVLSTLKFHSSGIFEPQKAV